MATRKPKITRLRKAMVTSMKTSNDPVMTDGAQIEGEETQAVENISEAQVKTLNGPGQPTKYHPLMVGMLIKHMGEGMAFESFGAVVNVGITTLHDWLAAHVEFSEAKRIGEPKSFEWWLRLGKAGATGTLRRVAKEVIRIDQEGNERVVEREYTEARYCSRTWSLMMKNRFGWAERIQLTPAGSNAPGLKPIGDMTDEEMDRELEYLKTRDDGVIEGELVTEPK